LEKRNANPLAASQDLPLGSIEERRDSQEEVKEKKTKNYIISIYPIHKKKVKRSRQNSHRSNFNSRKHSSLSKSPSVLKLNLPVRERSFSRLSFTSPQAFGV
jgi:hypothetical protein